MFYWSNEYKCQSGRIGGNPRAEKLWKEGLHSDSQRFHQYQQNEQPSLISKNCTLKNTTTYDIEIPGPGLGQADKCGRVIPVSGIPTSEKIIPDFFTTHEEVPTAYNENNTEHNDMTTQYDKRPPHDSYGVP